jgi:hypothetical protein
MFVAESTRLRVHNVAVSYMIPVLYVKLGPVIIWKYFTSIYTSLYIKDSAVVRRELNELGDHIKSMRTATTATTSGVTPTATYGFTLSRNDPATLHIQ